MKKTTRVLSLLLSIIMLLGMFPLSVLAGETTGLDNFVKVNSYDDSVYSDVRSDDWFYDNVKSAYEYGLMIGKNNNLFDTDGNVTIAETMTIAARLHSIYYNSKADFEQSEPWYQVYADYCKANGIADPALFDLTAPATRAKFAQILANAMPDEAWEAINKVADNAIPDVKTADSFSAAVYKLYRAGVLVGNDNNGTFAPNSNIRRSEVAAIVTRMAEASLRQSIQLGDETVSDKIEETEDNKDSSKHSHTQFPFNLFTTYYTVTFDSNGGSAVASQTVKKGECAVEPAEPTREGYNFAGWYSDSNLVNAYDFAAPVTKNTTVYAKWKTLVDDYLENNAEIISVIDVEKSEELIAEKDVKGLLDECGFSVYPITYRYTLDGECIIETEIENGGNDKRPMYETFYTTENGDVWVIYVVNGKKTASPVSFNLESSLSVEVLVSESDSVTSYDSTTNRFYVTKPQESSAIVITVDSVDADTLESLTIDEIYRLTGAISHTDSLTMYAEEKNSRGDNTKLHLLDFFPETSSSVTMDVLTSANTLSSIDSDPFIVVSLGDSYSSGEGVEPFFGQNKATVDKVKDLNWLAHRSQVSWASRLTVPGILGNNETLADYYVNISENIKSSAPIQWYFVAASGATTAHFNTSKQKKDYNKLKSLGEYSLFDSVSAKGTEYLPLQLDVFNKIDGDVDLVTFTIGGNDVKFADIIQKCAIESSYIHLAFFENTALQKDIKNLWDDIDNTMLKIEQAYKDVRNKAPNAAIIVAGYPILLDKFGKGAVISKQEASDINTATHDFNIKIAQSVEKCRGEGINIYYVDVETEFSKDNGHGAYASDAWINPIWIGAKSQDIDDFSIASSYSVHPNEKGLQAYAKCVNAKIAEIFSSSSITGTVTIADEDTDMTNNLPLEGASVSISKAGMTKSVSTDSNGAYSLSNISIGTYTIRIAKDGFITATQTLKISDSDVDIVYNAAIEAIPEAYEGIGFASGTIYDVATGYPVSGMTLYIRNGIDNTTGEVVSTIHNSVGTYSTSIGLDAGNYTVQVVDERTGIAEDARYITNHFNIKIFGDMTIGNQNGYISNKLYDEEIRVVLTWGQNPSDLDSHLVGPTTDGSKFHIYYSNKTYGGLADLDVDDTSSYGPETVTIHSFNEGVYTYAVHNYSNHSSTSSSALANSGAQVNVYRGQNLILTYNVPTDKDGTLWTVFSYDATTKTFKTINDISYDTSVGSGVLSSAPVKLMAISNSVDKRIQDDTSDETSNAIVMIFADVAYNVKED